MVDIAINVTVTGIILVFSMLFALVLILYVFGFVSVSVTKAKDKKAERAKLAALSDMKETVSVVVPDVQSATVNVSDDEEVVAVISAAIAAIYQNSNVKPVIKSIKKVSSRRSSWATAGIVDNTRAF